ncbi:MAG: hypothetical protein GX442_25140 [Candidatus Riflebacteria bacterium]|nr:hypothetical protein [Candidatus Riflebacteria bacterium]
MFRRYSLPTLLAIVATAAIAFGQALPATVTDVGNAICPSSGEKVQEGVTLLHEGKLYHFCCPDCFGAFQKDPAAMIAKITDAKETPLTVTNVGGNCPVTGSPAKADFYLVRGDKITFYANAESKGKDTLPGTPTSAPAPVAPAAAPAPADSGAAPAPQSEGEACGDCSNCSGCPSGH